MAVLHRLVTRRERMSAESAKVLREAVMAAPVAKEFDRVLALKALSGATERQRQAEVWPGGFTMISLGQVGRVWDAIRELPAKERPQDVRRAFDLVLLHLVPDEGRVNLWREEFAEKMGVRPEHASAALSVLVRMGVLRRELVRGAGVRGPGLAVYYVNENVAWNGDLDVRKARAAKRAPPLLRMMEGGKREHHAARELAPLL